MPKDPRPDVTKTLEIPAQEPIIGTVLAGRYRVIEELGRGGMGRVFLVFDADVKEKIALKLLNPEIAADSRTVERFSQELKLARKIRHKNICGMFDLGKADGLLYLTMEFVPGQDLKRLIREGGPVPAEMSRRDLRIKPRRDMCVFSTSGRTPTPAGPKSRTPGRGWRA